jgi:transposase
MSRSAADLPEDPPELRQFAAALAAEVHAKTLLIEKLRMQLSILRRARFGRSSEKLDREIEQLELLLGNIEEDDAEREVRTEAFDGEASSTLPSKKPSVRKPLPDHLPQLHGRAAERVVGGRHHLPADAGRISLPCGG